VGKLSIALFQQFEAHMGTAPITGFKSDKARALLAFLAMQPGIPHSRSSLAALLWPDLPEQTALSNLRSALANLRSIIEKKYGLNPAIFLVDYQTIQLLPDTFQCDVITFERYFTNGQLEEALKLYRGHLLQEFYSGSPMFDDWQRMQADILSQKAMQGLNTLIRNNLQTGNFSLALDYSRQQLTLDPVNEDAQQNMIYLLALNGQTSAALSQASVCRQILRKEMGVSPSAETLALEKAIQKRQKLPLPRLLRIRRSITLEARVTQPQLLVARENELEVLNTHLLSALNAQGKMVFISGSAGSGKTTLIQAFTRQAALEYPQLITLSSVCAKNGELAAPFYPFREILLQLTHLPEKTAPANAVDPIETRPLNQVNAFVLQTLSEVAPDLETLLNLGVPTFPGNPALKQGDLVTLSLHRGSLYQQSADLLMRLSSNFPLLITIDDLQWMDADSLHLLRFLGAHLHDRPILFVGAYRQEEIAAGKGGHPHPLEDNIQEFKRQYGDICLDLGQSDGRSFVDDYLNAVPNRLSKEFHETLYQHTGGHALFTIELLESLKKAGYLKLDEQHLWVDRREIDWNQMPARVEAIIHQQLKRMPVFWQHALSIASVEGEFFTGEVLAAVLNSQPSAIIQGLSRVVCRQFGLINLEDVRMVNGQRLSIFRFRHSVYQHFLYQQLDAAERSILHEEMGNALEGFYQTESDRNRISPQLALHFEQAGQLQKAASYYYRAGHAAIQNSAFYEAEKHLNHAYALLRQNLNNVENNRLVMDILTDLSTVDLALHGWGSKERSDVLSAANEAAIRAGAVSEQLLIRSKIVENLLGSGRWQEALQKNEETRTQVEQAEKDASFMRARMIQGVSYIFLGRLTEGLGLLEEVFAYFHNHREDMVFNDGNADELIARATYAIGLTFDGRLTQAQDELDFILAKARNDSSQLVLGMALTIGGISKAILLEDYQAVNLYSLELQTTPKLREYRGNIPWIEFLDGWQDFYNGQRRSGLKKLKNWEARWKTGRHFLGYPFLMSTLANTLRLAGQVVEGEKILQYTIQVLDQGTVSFATHAECIRILGECQAALGNEEKAEASFREAIHIAQAQGARLFQIKAANSLCQLKLNQGKIDSDLELLGNIYGRFPDGRDSAPLRTARELMSKGGILT
jgi:DNA-binding SARP family transcriptional activator/energy-coupling factor transporter ATP-binding protein EcfA2